MNNAANEDDVRNGTGYANRVGIKVTMPKWGFSKSDYFFDAKERVIAKGLSSIKYISAAVAEELYELARSKKHDTFIDVLQDIDKNSSINTRQIDVLIKIDFFSEYGNQRELMRLVDLYYNLFKQGEAKKIAKEKVDDTPIKEAVSKYSVGVNKSGGVAKSYTLLDIDSAMRESEEVIKNLHMSDLSDVIKVRNFYDVMGYIGYVSGKEEDRRKLYVLDIYPLRRKADGLQFGYSVVTKSIGSGKEARFTVRNKVFNEEPIEKGDIIHIKGFERDKQYYRLTRYEKIY